ncbi:hypothetical protein TrRE_jg2685 [Triparma retinervis]|uniref:Transmembrane protein n=1 Tax=Triparma retinervis TaxID=2557542 RepID=A0A9W6Z6C9_9STRA|nr:hypothetical protein TrRE_jg2685 [Triparma retinervis]
MSVIRGTTRSSTSAFRLSAVTAILHVALVYPSIIGNLEVTLYNKMWTTGSGMADLSDYNAPLTQSSFFGTGCTGFWSTYYLSYYNDPTDPSLTANVVAGSWVHPSPSQVSSLCRDTWVSFVAQAAIFVLMHVQVVACGMVYRQNRGRQTDVYDPQPPTAPKDPREERLLQDADYEQQGHVIGGNA